MSDDFVVRLKKRNILCGVCVFDVLSYRQFKSKDLQVHEPEAKKKTQSTVKAIATKAAKSTLKKDIQV